MCPRHCRDFCWPDLALLVGSSPHPATPTNNDREATKVRMGNLVAGLSPRGADWHATRGTPGMDGHDSWTPALVELSRLLGTPE